MGKATDFKFGQYIRRVHPKKSPLKMLEKRERGLGISRDCSFFWIAPRNYEIMNFAHTFIGSIGTKAHQKFRKK